MVSRWDRACKLRVSHRNGYDGTVMITGVPTPTTFTYTAAAGLGAATLANATVTGLFGVTKVGPGTLDYTAANTYQGLTQVNQGTLLLDNSSGPSLNGNLTISANLPSNAVAQWNFSNQVPANATVIVNNDGDLNLNGKTNALAALIMTDGQATTGSTGAGVLTVGSLNMTGSTFMLATASSQVILNGNVKATSDASGSATISGPGTLSLGGTTSQLRSHCRGTQKSDLGDFLPHHRHG